MHELAEPSDRRGGAGKWPAMPEMSIIEAAATLVVSPETIRKRVRRGELPSHKDDRGHYLVDVEFGLPPPPEFAGNGVGAALQAAELLRLQRELAQAVREIEHRDELLTEARQRAERAEKETDRLSQQLAAATVRELQGLVHGEIEEIRTLAEAPEQPSPLALERQRRPRGKRRWQFWRRGVRALPEPQPGQT